MNARPRAFHDCRTPLSALALCWAIALPGQSCAASPTPWPTQPAAMALPAIPLDPPGILPTREVSTATASPEAPGSATDPPLRFRISRPSHQPDPRLATARAHLARGELDAARLGFELLLRQDPHHLPALLALAAIARQQQRPDDAGLWQQRALAADPGNPAVLASVLGSASGRGDPLTAESRLKELLSRHPECAELHFALGNLLARQQRWPEAQTAYFNASAVDEGNPDYRFNLAVSLEHLRRPKLAVQQYREALSAAERRAPVFSPATARQRLAALSAEARP